MPSPLSRRTFLAAAGAAVVAGQMPARAQAAQTGFTHGVASGDPLADRVILWTRYVPPSRQPVDILWEVARDAAFADIVRSGTARTDPMRDYCIKVDAAGLSPDQIYAFRFRAAGQESAVGQTRTLPVEDAPSLTVAVFSCANMATGFFNAYRHCAMRADVDLWLHLGDYFYEVPAPVDAADRPWLGPERRIAPSGEARTLNDYRARIASYRSDPDLQALHARLPLIAVWDDHEFANDAWSAGAQDHDPQRAGPWSDRRMAAMQAYMEWMPVRPQPLGRIYRRFDWGRLASLIMLDTRLVGRNRQLDIARWLARFAPDGDEASVAQAIEAFRIGPLGAADRTLLGGSQERWLANQLRQSRMRGAIWQVLGQQVIVSDLVYPSNAAALANPSVAALQRVMALRGQLGGHGLAANLDAWAGYPAARTRLMETLRREATNSIILSADSHNAWAFEHDRGVGDRPLTVEFSTPSINAPGLDSMLGIAPSRMERAMLNANPQLRWCNLWQRGYLTVRFTAEDAIAEWSFLATVRERSQEIASRRTISVAARPGTGVERLKL